MSTAVRLPSTRSHSSRRIPLLAALSALVAAAAISIALALAGGGGGDTALQPSAAAPTATPDRATLYQRGVEAGQPGGPTSAPSAAERFHHFR